MFVPPEVIIVPFTFGIPAAVIVIRMWFRHTEKMASIAQPTAPSPEIESRLDRVEQSLEAIAIEMERVGEGQRFLTKLLADRSNALPDPTASSRPGPRN